MIDEEIETTEITEPAPAPEPGFLDKPFDDYTVTEGLLLCILLVFIISGLIKLVKGAFSWL